VSHDLWPYERNEREKEKAKRKERGKCLSFLGFAQKEGEKRAIPQKWRITKGLENRVMMVPY
jgi:hypothetical protein